MSGIVAEIRNMTVAFGPTSRPAYALRNASFDLRAGQITGIVGESGSGKSTLGLAMIGLLPAGARTLNGSLRIAGNELVGMPERDLRKLRGATVSMVFQDPMTSLNPCRTIGGHLTDAQLRSKDLSKREVEARAIDMLRKVGVPDPEQQYRRYPHQLSGGMRQRVAIAIALLGRPQLLIADEPTTALDVTLEAQILHLLRELRREVKGSILFISHNLGAVAEICDHVVVLYAGEIVEEGPVRDVFHNPLHPYTKALIECDPARIKTALKTLPTIRGDIPLIHEEPRSCVFSERCPRATDLCRSTVPTWTVSKEGHGARCHYAGKRA